MADQPPVGALAGIRVLDLADESAVFATKLLSDLGADVIRIEPPEGDPIRRLGPFAEVDDGGPPRPSLSPGERGEVPVSDGSSENLSLSHWWFNSGKRSAVLDLTTGAGQEQLADLATGADIVVETGGTGVDWAAVRADRPEVTVVSITPFGLSGPRRDWLAPDLIAWALGGAMGTTGLPGRPPLRSNWALSYQVAGLYGAIGALTGLYHRRQTGRGLHFDLSRQEAVASIAENLIIFSVYTGAIQGRSGVEHPSAVPWGAFPTRDGQVIFIPLTQGQWGGLLEWMKELGEVEPWALDEALLPMSGRVPRRAEIHAWLGRWTRQFTTSELVREANRRRLPCAPINTPLDILQDEQLQARGFFVEVDQPGLGRPVLIPNVPYRFPDGASVRPAPAWGSGVGGGVSWLPRRDERSSGDPSGRAADPAGSPDSRLPTPDTPPLAGLRVLDFTWAVAGPSGSRVLADLGAEVVKVEPPGIGDLLRGLPPHWQGNPDPNWGGHYHRLNRNKRNLTLDLKRPEAIAIVKRLAAWADVVIDNYGAGVMERLGLGPEVLRAIKPELVLASLSGYGQEGPTRSYPSYALISTARGGVVSGTAYADGAVAGPGIALGDTGAGVELAIVVLAAVEQARRTGRGAFVDMSQLEAAIVLAGPALLEASVNGRAFVPPGNLLPDRDAAPHGAYPVAGEDRWIAIAVLDEDQWQRLAKVMGRPDLPRDLRFATAADRVAHVEDLDALIGAWTKDQDGYELADQLQAAGVPAGMVQNAIDLLERDPHLLARGLYQAVEQPEIGSIPMDTMPLRWGDGPVPLVRPAPLVGEHNEYVLREILDLSEEEYVDLIAGGVI